MKTKSFVWIGVKPVLALILFLFLGTFKSHAQTISFDGCTDGISYIQEVEHWFEFSEGTDFESLSLFDLLKGEKKKEVKLFQKCHFPDGTNNTTVWYLNPDEVFKGWMTQIGKMELNDSGIDVFDQSGEFVQHVEYDEQKLENEISRPYSIMVLPEFPEMNQQRIFQLEINGFKVNEINNGIYEVRNEFEQVIYNENDFSVEFRKMSDDVIVVSEKRTFFQNEGGGLLLGQTVQKRSAVLGSGTCGNFVTVTNYSNLIGYDNGNTQLFKTYLNKDQIEESESLKHQGLVIERSEGNRLKGSITIFPNPAGDLLKIQSKKGGNLQLAITDLNGKLIKDFGAINAEVTQVDISDLSEGIYFVRVTEEGFSHFEKLIKQ